MDRPSRVSSLPPVLALALVLIAAACAGGRPAATSPASSASPASTSSGTGGPTLSPGAIGTPFSPPWPSGWDTAFCTLFGELVVMQELAVDIGRALDDGDRDDARALTAELDAGADTVLALLGDLPEWATAEPLRPDVEALVTLAEEMALRYGRFLNQNRNQALNAARNAGAQMREVVPPLVDRLVLLNELGLACPGLPFDLEMPPAT